jgi:hypothetical protein
MNNNTNPFNVKFEQVFMTKFSGQDRMNITPQVMEFTLYQTIFDNLIKADMVIGDAIGLMNNYPLTGEETIDVAISYNDKEGNKSVKTLKFVVTGIRGIRADDQARSAVFAFDLASIEAFINAKSRVSHAYNDTIENMIKEVYQTYVAGRLRNGERPKPLSIIQDTTKITKLVIPNIKPFEAINWLCKYAISSQPDLYYTHIFYETLEGFQFKPLQRKTYQGVQDQQAVNECIKSRFIYISNFENFKKDQANYNAFLQSGYDDARLINDVVINKRYSAMEKIVGGYFENELVEVNNLQRDYRITYTSLKTDGSFNTLYPTGVYDYPEYIQNVINEYTTPESSARIRYIINSYDDVNQPSFRDKFGKSSMSFLAFQQVDLSVAVTSDLNIRPGDIIWIDFPKLHGFNINEIDLYISGLFIVSEMKTTMTVGGRSQTYLRVNKDSWGRKLNIKSDYALESNPLVPPIPDPNLPLT